MTAPPDTAPEAAESDDQAWAALQARWDDEEAHLAFLARFADLPGLADAGRRYREVLAQRPGDAAALRWRDEIVRRATVRGLAQLPRLGPPRASPGALRWAALAGTIGAMALAVGWMAWRLLAAASR